MPPVGDLLRYFPSVNTAEDDMRWVALTYAEAGVPVFPCKPGEKVPNCPNGVHDATTDPDRIAAWWGRRRHDNIGLACGVLFDVLDVDVAGDKPGAESLRKVRGAGLLTGVWAVTVTPSGGRHLLLPVASDTGNHTSRHGLDYRGRGGYVVAPPSQVGGSRYQWAQVKADRRDGPPLSWQALMAVLEPPRPVRPRPQGEGVPGKVEALADFVAGQAEGNRNAALYWAARKAVDEGHDPAVLVDAATHAGLAVAEAQRTVASAERAVR